MAYQKLTPIIATGATAPRYLGDRFADIVNLKDFGATGDGETDDSTAWAAWQAALKTGGMPYAPAGNYLLDDTLVHIPNGRLGGSFAAVEYEDDGDVWTETSNPIYVDATNGNDANTGMTSSDAVKTISRAVDIVEYTNTKGSGLTFVKIAGGTYSEDINVNRGKKVHFELGGNVTLGGSINATESSILYISSVDSNTKTLTISVTSDEAGNAIEVSYGAMLSVNTPLSMSKTSNNTQFTFIDVSNESFVNFWNTVEITSFSTNVSKCVYVQKSSIVHFFNSFVVSETTKQCDVCVFAAVCSYVLMTDTQDNSTAKTLRGSTCVRAWTHSTIEFGSASLLSLYFSFVCLDAASFGHISIGSGVADSLFSTSGATGCISCHKQSMIEMNMVKATFSGSVTWAVADCGENSYILILQTITITNSMTGRRCWIERMGIVDVRGAGSSRVPGNGNVDVVSISYGYYG